MGVSIVIEGPDGAGKSTLCTLTRILFEETTSLPVLITQEPGGTNLGTFLRESVVKGREFRDIHPLASTFVFSAGRAELYFKKETPFLEENRNGILIKDRSWLSTLVFQEVEGVTSEYLKIMQEPFMKIPDKFAIDDIPVLETVVRMESALRYSGERKVDWRDEQTQDNLEKIRANYLAFALENRDRCLILDCFDDPWEKAARIKFEAFKLLAKKEGSVLEEGTLDLFMQEAREIGAIYSGPEGGQFGRYDITEYRNQVEETRKKLGFPSRDELRTKMHSEWMSLGLEDFSTGLERK